MKYCTNCGAKSKKKFCDACDAKQNTKHNFCGWCGAAIDEGAKKCGKCGEPFKEGFGKKLTRFLFVVVEVLIFLFCLLNAVAWGMDLVVRQYGGFMPVLVLVLFVLAAVVAFPLLRKPVKKITIGKTTLRAVLNALRVVLAIVFLFVGVMIGFSNDTTGGVTKNGVKEAALTAFHEMYTLKNEQSFVLNDWTYTEETVKEDGVTYFYYYVVLDWSAQNGFGGMAREQTLITIKINQNTDVFYYLDTYNRWTAFVP